MFLSNSVEGNWMLTGGKSLGKKKVDFDQNEFRISVLCYFKTDRAFVQQQKLGSK